MAPGDAAPKQPSLHPVYTVTNIQNKVPILDGIKVTYSSWVKLFKLHARGYKVLDHIDDTPPPAKTDAEYETWAEIDAIVLQWIYGTLSDDLLVRVLETDTAARKAWIKIQDIFLNNKGSRAAALEHEFINLTLAACSSMDEYCQKLKDTAAYLQNILPTKRLQSLTPTFALYLRHPHMIIFGFLGVHVTQICPPLNPINSTLAPSVAYFLGIPPTFAAIDALTPQPVKFFFPDTSFLTNSPSPTPTLHL
ncbi:hypothetical protein OSB04_000252 [Centaurea solstitialis]|uniref:Uncharacterized protein n=1 Tax=Centaurea solstitialis TaxID=347529 RepID=A0AA38U1E4_9ASTR|nr:hypothetical protein OSB04_000252 [Centaurea solstitialis]